MKTKMIYLVSPYTDKDTCVMYNRERLINRIGALLSARTGHAFFPPITVSAIYKRLYPHKFGHSFKAWKNIDLCAMLHCDEVWVIKLDGWDRSVGVKAEIKFASKHEIPIKYINPISLTKSKNSGCAK